MTPRPLLSRCLVFPRVVAVMIAGVLLACCENQQPTWSRHESGTLRVTVFDLKRHGLAIAVQTPSGALYLVDTGGRDDGRDGGKDTIAPFLRAQEIRAIDGIVVSHPDHDHYEGAEYLVEHFPVRNFWDAGLDPSDLPKDYREVVRKVGESGTKIGRLRAGDVLALDPALEVTVLGPPADGIDTRKKDRANDHSVVLRIRHGENVFLLPGDIETAGADFLLAARTAPVDLNATVLVAPHHGYFDHEAFAKAVQPAIVIVSCLKKYKDRSPKDPGRIAERLFGSEGTQVYVTAKDGHIEVVSDGVRSHLRVTRR